MSSASTISKAAGPAPTPRTRNSSRAPANSHLNHARLTAFGSTRFAKNPVEEDRNVLALVEAGTPVVSIFGKTWDLHVKRALGITEEENLQLISETVRYLKDHGKEVVYDAEHFFDGYTANPDLRPAHARSRASTPAPTSSASATPTAARSPAAWSRSSPKCAAASMASSASTRTTIPTWPSPTPWPPSKPAPPTCRAA